MTQSYWDPKVSSSNWSTVRMHQILALECQVDFEGLPHQGSSSESSKLFVSLSWNVFNQISRCRWDAEYLKYIYTGCVTINWQYTLLYLNVSFYQNSSGRAAILEIPAARPILLSTKGDPSCPDVPDDHYTFQRHVPLRLITVNVKVTTITGITGSNIGRRRSEGNIC